MNDVDDEMLNLEWEGSGRLRARPSEGGPGCASEHELVVLAHGDLIAEREQELLSHCADCDFCAARLKEAIALIEPLTLEQQRLVDNLPSMRSGASLASRMTKGRRAFPTRWMQIAASLLFVALLYPFYSRWQQHRASEQLAQQLAKLRPIEFRLDGVGYGQYHQSMGAADSVSVDLARIAPGSVDSWRAAVLEGDFDSAIRQIDNTLGAGPRKPSLLNDLAAAHAARGDQLRSDHEYEIALALLDEALSKSPDFRPALFNRMLVLDRLHRSEERRKAAERELHAEPNPGWRAEAQSFLERK